MFPVTVKRLSFDGDVGGIGLRSCAVTLQPWPDVDNQLVDDLWI